MNRMNCFSNTVVRIGMVGVLAVALLATGCGDHQSGDESTVSQKPAGPPKLSFHKPKNFAGAVERLREIYDAAHASEPLPEPKKFDVVEVIHGKGASAHSHYYLASAYKPGTDDHGHSHMETEEKRHEIQIDVFTEFRDIANWMPKIAAASSSVGQEDWTAIKEIATELASAASDAMSGKDEPAAIRESFCSAEQPVEGLLQKLEAYLHDDQSADTKDASPNA